MTTANYLERIGDDLDSIQTKEWGQMATFNSRLGYLLLNWDESYKNDYRGIDQA
jgi:hypothetical protein